MEPSAPLHLNDTHGSDTSAPGVGRVRGIGRLLILVYGILALAATGRSFVQIVTKFENAPLAYLLSALSAVVYIVATIALIKRGATWYRVAWVTIAFELLGVLVVGFLSIFDAVLFPSDTVWSVFGRGYLFIPLVLPVLGMIWLSTGGRSGAGHVGAGRATAPASGSTTEPAA